LVFSIAASGRPPFPHRCSSPFLLSRWGEADLYQATDFAFGYAYGPVPQSHKSDLSTRHPCPQRRRLQTQGISSLLDGYQLGARLFTH